MLGRSIRFIHSFTSAADRDAWVEKSPTDLIGAFGYREAVRRRDITAHEMVLHGADVTCQH